MSDATQPRSAAEIRADIEELQRLHTEHLGWSQGPNAAIATLIRWHSARAFYELAAQVAAMREVICTPLDDKSTERLAEAVLAEFPRSATPADQHAADVAQEITEHTGVPAHEENGVPVVDMLPVEEEKN